MWALLYPLNDQIVNSERDFGSLQFRRFFSRSPPRHTEITKSSFTKLLLLLSTRAASLGASSVQALFDWMAATIGGMVVLSVGRACYESASGL
jgi:hypothetical protein